MPMDNMVRVACVSPEVHTANPRRCLEAILEEIEKVRESSPDLIVLSMDCLCGTGGFLMQSAALISGCEAAYRDLLRSAADIPAVFAMGMTRQFGSSLKETAVVFHQGQEVASFCPELRTGSLPILSIGGLRFTVCPGDPDKWIPCFSQLSQKSDLIVLSSNEPAIAGSVSRTLSGIQFSTDFNSCAAALSNGGLFDSSSPYLRKGYAAVFECGKKLACDITQTSGVSVISDLDFDLIRSLSSGRITETEPVYNAAANSGKSGWYRPVSPAPFLPAEPVVQDAYLDQLFDLQAMSLATRMKNTGISSLVLGVSGGLDSTLALLACARAADLAGINRENITGVTMPGFGTTDRTYYNALRLMDGLGVFSRDISIRQSVLQHFEDIAHDPAEHDVVYENAQARERAQILFDLANGQNALVVGTGDLSEAALGFCTFAGDQIANYNVNASIPKTVIRRLITHLAQSPWFEAVGTELRDVIETPVSPELLPPGEAGEILQVTEDILGPYDLHDFFLYYFIRYRMKPSKIYGYACHAFAGQYREDDIYRTLRVFLRRFTSSQFKRSCSPDAAQITEISLSPPGFTMPSDISPAVFLNELDSIDPGTGNGI